MKRLFIVHGYKANPSEHWLPWLAKQAEMRGFHVEVPAMPSPSNPDPIKWLAKLEQVVGKIDKDTYFAAHSLGCAAVLRFIESEPVDKETGRLPTAGGLILVGAFAKPISNEHVIPFIEHPFDFEKIRAIAPKIVLIHSEDDPRVPYENATYLKGKLNADLVSLEHAGHINSQAGFCDLPIALEKLLELSKA